MHTMYAIMNVEEGQCDEDTYIASMQYLIDTAIVWSLQGFFGRRAVELIEAGVCTAPDWVETD